MASKYKKTNLLKNLPFHSEEIENSEKKNKKFSNIKFLSELPFFSKKPKELTNKKMSDVLPFPPKRKRRPKRLTKHQVLSNIVSFYDDVGISRRQHAHKGYAEAYDVEVIDNTSLDDSLFLAKRSINDLFRDSLREKRGFKYTLLATITLKRWNNAINRYDIETIYIRSEAITVANQRFNLSKTYEKLKYLLYIRADLGSGWIVDKTEDIRIDIVNYDPLAGSSYI